MATRTALGLTASIMGIVGYVIYFRSIYRGVTKPHAFTWLVWGVLTTIGFMAQVNGDAGPGAWVTGVTAAASFAIAITAFWMNQTEITRADYYFLGAAALVGLIWFASNNALLSVVFVITIDTLGLAPTIRKTLAHPEQEALIHYFLAGTKFVIGIAALSEFNLLTALYPMSLVVANYGFIAMALVRRSQLEQSTRSGTQVLTAPNRLGRKQVPDFWTRK